MSPSPIDGGVAAPARSLGRRLGSRLGPPHTLLLHDSGAFAWAPDVSAPPEALASAIEWLSTHPGCRVNVVLGGSLTRQVVVADAGLPLDDETTLVAWARHQLAAYHGDAALSWPIVPWLSARQRGACALNGIDLFELRRVAAVHGVQLRRVEPWWSVALRAAEAQAPLVVKQPSWGLALVEATGLTWVACEHGRVAAIVHRRLDQALTADVVELVAELMADSPRPLPACIVGHGLRDSGPWPEHLFVPAAIDRLMPPITWVRP